MLGKIMLRDVILNRWPLGLNGLLFIVWLTYFAFRADGPKVFVFFTAIMMTFLPLTIFTREDMAKASASVCYLPVSRRDIVWARTVLAWFLMGGGVFVMFAVLGAVPGNIATGWSVFAPSHLFLAAGVLAVVSAIMLPFSIRFGFMGVIGFLVTIQGLGILLVLIASMGNVRLRPSTGAAMVTSALAQLRERVDTLMFYLILSAAFVTIIYLSYRVSIFLYERREF